METGNCRSPAWGPWGGTHYWLAIIFWLRKLKDLRLSTIFRNCCLSVRSSAWASCSLTFSVASWRAWEPFFLYFFTWMGQGVYKCLR